MVGGWGCQTGDVRRPLEMRRGDERVSEQMRFVRRPVKERGVETEPSVGDAGAEKFRADEWRSRQR